MEQRVLKLLTSWTQRTEYILRLEIEKNKIGDTGSLEKSLKSEVMRLSEEKLEAQFEFLTRGRFVDMGAGRNYRKLESRQGNEMLLNASKRKPKKWYSRAFWGRLNDLQGAIGYQLMEEAIDTVKKNLEST
jgi:hypothetical protein